MSDYKGVPTIDAPLPDDDDAGVKPLFSIRLNMAKKAESWCKERNIPILPVNIVTALFAIGDIKGCRK